MNPGDPAEMILVLGYGNTLRGDDGLGPRVAAAIAQKNWPQVVALSLPQLTPELAEPLARIRAAIFIDAVINSDQPGVSILSITAVETDYITTHQCEPRSLLALARTLYGRAPAAWLVEIAGEDFGLGETLSGKGQRNVRDAVSRVGELIRSLLPVRARAPARGQQRPLAGARARTGRLELVGRNDRGARPP